MLRRRGNAPPWCPGAAKLRPHSHAAEDRYLTLRAEAATALSGPRRCGLAGDGGGAALRGAGVRHKKRSAPSRRRWSWRLVPASWLRKNAGIGWLHLQLCSGTPGCDIRDVATVLRWGGRGQWRGLAADAGRGGRKTGIRRKWTAFLADMAPRGAFRFLLEPHRGADGRRSRGCGADQLPGGLAGSDSAKAGHRPAESPAARSFRPSRPLVEACRESNAAPERRDLCMKLSRDHAAERYHRRATGGFSASRGICSRPTARRLGRLPSGGMFWSGVRRRRPKFDDPLLPWTKRRAVPAHGSPRCAPCRRQEDVCIAILREHKMALDPPEAHP